MDSRILPIRIETETLGQTVASGHKGGTTMSFAIYIIGYIILIIGLAIGAYLLHVPPRWMAVGIICLVGLGIAHGVTATRQKDTSS